MKKILLLSIILFWSMIFPSFSFNSFTTQIENNAISYRDLYDAPLRQNILHEATFDLYLFHP